MAQIAIITENKNAFQNNSRLQVGEEDLCGVEEMQTKCGHKLSEWLLHELQCVYEG